MSEQTKKAPKLSPGGRTTFPCLSTPADEEEEAKRKRQTANRAALGRARKAAGNAAPGRRSAATFEERPTPTNGVNRYMHELSPSGDSESSPTSRRQRQDRRNHRVQATRAAAAKREITEEIRRIDYIDNVRVVDGRFAKARSASAVAAAAAQSNADCVRRTTAAKKATAAEKTQRARALFGSLKRELSAGRAGPYGIQDELVRVEFLGNDGGDVSVSVGFVSHFFEFANSAENAAVVFKALGIIVHAFGGKAALACARAGIHEEFVILLTKFSANVGAVSAAFAALDKMVEPEVVSEDIPDDEVTDPRYRKRYVGETSAATSPQNLVYFGVGPVVIEALRNFTRDDVLQRNGWSSLLGLMHWNRPKFLRSLSDAGLAGLILARIQQLVGNGIMYESDEDYSLYDVCRVVEIFAFHNGRSSLT